MQIHMYNVNDRYTQKSCTSGDPLDFSETELEVSVTVLFLAVSLDDIQAEMN